MMDELKEVIQTEIDNKLKEIRYRMTNNVPMEFIHPIQTEIFILQWVLEQIENLEKKEEQDYFDGQEYSNYPKP